MGAEPVQELCILRQIRLPVLNLIKYFRIIYAYTYSNLIFKIYQQFNNHNYALVLIITNFLVI